MADMKGKKKKSWSFPWGYSESFSIAFGLVLIGLIIELITNSSGVDLPSWPYNAIILVVFATYMVITQKLWEKHPFVIWLSGTQASIAAICTVTTLILIMGFVPQNNPGDSFADKLGLTNIVGNWAFIFSSLLLLIILGFTIIRRLLPLSVKNVAFFLNHFGLWIILAAGFMGSSDSQTYMMRIEEGNKTHYAYDNKGKTFILPFSIQLNDFVIEEYDPKLVMVKVINNKVIEDETELITIKPGTKTIINNYEIEFVKYFVSALNYKGNIEESDKEGNAPAVFLRVKKNNSDFAKENWVSCGSYLSANLTMELDNNYFIGMNDPAPRKFSSDITIFEDGKKPYNKIIEVNKPMKIQGWKTYQISYDEKRGKWSKISVFELVRDPWLIVVYIGIFMVLGGAVYLFWTGNFASKKK